MATETPGRVPIPELAEQALALGVDRPEWNLLQDWNLHQDSPLTARAERLGVPVEALEQTANSLMAKVRALRERERQAEQTLEIRSTFGEQRRLTRPSTAQRGRGGRRVA